MKCMENNKICRKYNKKCKNCILDDEKKAYSLADYFEAKKIEEEIEKFNKEIPNTCKKCTLLEKDMFHKTVRCLYRNKNTCILEAYMEKKNERNNSVKQNR